MIHIFVIIYKMKRAQVEKNLLTLFFMGVGWRPIPPKLFEGY